VLVKKCANPFLETFSMEKSNNINLYNGYNYNVTSFDSWHCVMTDENDELGNDDENQYSSEVSGFKFAQNV